MKTIKKNFNAIVLCAGFVIVICLAFIASRPGYAAMNATNSYSGRTSNTQWLSQYEGKRVKVTFVQTPTHIDNNLKKSTYLDLVDAGEAGIVIGIKPQRTIFVPYSQIASIEPAYNTR